MALYYCCCWQIASKKPQLPHCWGRNAGVGNISIWGSSVFWEEVRGAGVPSSPVGAPRQRRQELLPVPLPARCLAAQHPAAHGGSRGRRGEARQFVVMLHFLLQNSVFTTIGLACPRSSGLRSRLCCFISVSSGSFLFAPAGRLLFHVFPPLPHAVPARQPATCSKGSFPLLCPAPPQPPAPLAVQTLIRCFGHRCLGPAPVFDRSALCDKRVDTWTVASPSITTLSLALFTFVTVSPFDSHICNVDLGGWPSGFLPPPLAVAWYPPPPCSSNQF